MGTLLFHFKDNLLLKKMLSMFVLKHTRCAIYAIQEINRVNFKQAGN